MAETKNMNPVAKWWQRQLGIIDNPNRNREVAEMSDPAFAVQNLLGLVTPESANYRRRYQSIPVRRTAAKEGGPNFIADFWQRQLGKSDSPERAQEVVDMTGPAFAIQNLLGLISPEQAAARESGNTARNITTATPSENVRPAPEPTRSSPRSTSQALTGPDARAAANQSRQQVRSLTPDEESRQIGAPGSGGLPDESHRGDTRLPPDPNGPMTLEDQVNGSYNRYGAMLDDMSQVYAELADKNMGEIANIFGEVAGTARAGNAPLIESYGQAHSNIGGIYDNLDTRLGSIAGELQGIAEGAAGSATGDVASTARSAISPFEAASATGRANAQANVQQHSNAGQRYLGSLADASTEEGKMHATRLQAAADQRQAEFDIKRMELELAREEALREVAMDTAGQAAEREAVAALFGAAGIPLPEGMGMDMAANYLNLGQDLGMFPGSGSGSQGSEIDQMRSQLSPLGTNILNTAIQKAEGAWQTADEYGQGGGRTQDFMFDIMAALDDEIAAQQALIGEAPGVAQRLAEEEAELIRQIIRDEYGKF